MATDLSKYNKGDFHPGRNKLVILLWYLVNHIVFRSAFFPFYILKVQLLRIFGAQVGHGVFIKPSVNIKYPWCLELGNEVWIGEDVWIDNLVMVQIGDHVCLSQGAMLLTGNHDYTRSSFDLLTGSIVLENGVWIGAKAIVCPGITAKEHSVLAAGSVANQPMEAHTIYQGNPAVAKKKRHIQ